MAHLLAPLPKRWGSIFVRLTILRSICCRSHGSSSPRVVLVPELTAIADRPQAVQVNLSSRSDSRTSSGHWATAILGAHAFHLWKRSGPHHFSHIAGRVSRAAA